MERIDNDISVTSYCLLEYIKKNGNKKNLKTNIIMILDSFTSQGLNNVPYEEFEAEFPSVCASVESIIDFVGNTDNSELIGKFVYFYEKRERLYKRKPNSKLNSDEYDFDDYELAQKPSQIPFHM